MRRTGRSTVAAVGMVVELVAVEGRLFGVVVVVVAVVVGVLVLLVLLLLLLLLFLCCTAVPTGARRPA